MIPESSSGCCGEGNDPSASTCKGIPVVRYIYGHFNEKGITVLRRKLKMMMIIIGIIMIMMVTKMKTTASYIFLHLLHGAIFHNMDVDTLSVRGSGKK
jgi:hypothetical protein